MARIYSSGFEINSLTSGMEWKTVTGSPTLATAVKRTGTYSMRCNPTAATAFVYTQFNESATAGPFFARAYVRIASAPAANVLIMQLGNATSLRAGIVLNTDRTLQGVGMAKASIGSPSSALSLDTWYRVEMSATDTATTTGTAEFKLDGSTFASQTATTPDIDDMDSISVGIIESTTADVYFDDIAVNDNSGSYQTTFPGAGSIVHLLPDGDETIGWTAINPGSPTTHYTKVNENPPDDATSYVETTDTNDTDIYTLASTASVGIGASDAITLITANARWNDVTSSIASFSMGFYDGTTTEDGASTDVSSAGTYVTNTDHDLSISISYRPLHITYDVLGASTTALTPSNLDSFRLRLKTLDADTYRVSGAWALVEYVPAGGSAYDSTLSETLVLTDTLLKYPARTLSDTLVDTDTIETSRGRYGVLSDTLVLTDTVLKEAGKILSDVLVLTGSIAFSTTRILSETLTFIDTVLNSVGRNLSDTLTNTDTVLKTPGKTLSDTTSLTDSIVRGIDHILSEVLVLVDTVLKGTERILSDTLTLLDTFTGIATTTLAEVLVLTDSLLKLTGRALSEVLVLTDTAIKASGRVLSDTLVLTDSILKSAGRILSEIGTLTDSIVKGIGRDLSDVTTLVDTALKSVSRTLTDVLATSGSMISSSTRILSEVLTLSDTLIKSIGRILSDTLVGTATVLKTASRTLLDNLVGTDTIAIGRTLIRVYAEVTVIFSRLYLRMNESTWYIALTSASTYARQNATEWYQKLNTAWRTKDRGQ